MNAYPPGRLPVKFKPNIIYGSKRIRETPGIWATSQLR
jgi:hypothetical protein